MIGIARSTVRDMVVRFERSGLSWPVPAEISDAELEGLLYGPAGVKPGRRKQSEPDWSVVARELKRKHVTLQVLWEEYIAAHPDGYRYSRWCELFRNWEGRLSLVMRQSHAGGEKLFVDYAGDTVPVVVNRRTGETREAHLFVAVLGGSSLSFACATVLLARSRKPKDKAKVEACVGIVERWALGRLRNRIFYSLSRGCSDASG
jgi:transposase